MDPTDAFSLFFFIAKYYQHTNISICGGLVDRLIKSKRQTNQVKVTKCVQIILDYIDKLFSTQLNVNPRLCTEQSGTNCLCKRIQNIVTNCIEIKFIPVYFIIKFLHCSPSIYE